MSFGAEEYREREQAIRTLHRKCENHPFYSGRYEPELIAPGCAGCKSIRAARLKLDQ